MLNFNVDPYYDDFDPNKNFHRVLFRPGRAVQARELTQSQTILQDQISKFANHIFKQNTPVTGGQVTINTRARYLRLTETFNDNDVVASEFLNQIITDSTGIVFAKVIATEESVSGDPPTLVVTYLSGKEFSAGDTILGLDTNTLAQIVPADHTGFSTTASISEGVFYIVNGYSFSDTQNPDGSFSRYSIGNFVSVQPQTIIVQKYGNTPTRRIGLSISEYVTDYVTDPSLLDPAVGATNYQAPGADRYTISLNLDTKTIELGNDSGFIELVRITNGTIQRLVNGTVYATIDDYFAKRTFDTNGDFVVNDFKLAPKANTANSQTYQVQVGPGVAYIKGYRVESVLETTLETTRARTTEALNNNNLTVDYGNYVYVNNANGVFDVTKVVSVDFHTINSNSALVTSSATTYNATKAGSALIRGLEFESASDTANTQTYVYKAYLTDFNNNTLSETATAGTTNTIQFPNLSGKFSAVANAYYGVTLTIDSGSSAGDVRKIVSYDGSTRTATVDVPFTVTPTTSSVFSLRFNVGNYNMMVAPTSTGFNRSASAGIDPSSKTDGIVSGVSILPTVVTNPTSPELIFPIGYDYVYNLSDQTYNSWKMSRGVNFASGVGQFSLTGDVTFVGTASATQSPTEARNNWIVIKNSTGEVINFTSANTISLDPTKKIATLSTVSGGDTSTYTGTIIARTAITNAGTTGVALRIKNLITANTTGVNLSGTNIGGVRVDLTNGQVYYPASNIVTPGSKQTLYISDAKRIVKVIDTGAPTIAPTDAMLTNSAYDVTNNFLFDNGQTDAYYGHSSITLRTGAPKINGQMLVLLDYYQHAGGDGYFSINSYLGAGDDGVSSNPENYAEIGTYTGKTSGISYSLRDCIDFRLSVVNAQSSPNTFGYSTSITGSGGSLIPVDSSTFITDYTHYLGRNDILVLTKDNSFKIIQGKPSNAPTFPQQPDGSLLLAQLTLDPYTAYLPGETTRYLPNLSTQKVQHKRWRMQDISDLQTRVNNIEYYTSLSLLEKQAADLQVPDSNGLNRFKNGILVDNFTGFATVDASNKDFHAKINKRLTYMTAADWIINSPLFPKDGLNALGNLSEAAQQNLSYKYHTKTGGTSTVITLPYTTANLAVQKLASNTVSLNPFAVEIQDGILNINPPMDMWVQSSKEPDILIVDPNMTLFREGSTLNTLSTSDWGAISGTTYSTATSSGRTVTVSTYQDQQRQTVTGNFEKTSSITGNFISDVSIQPYIRSQNIILRAKGMKINTPVNVYFDNTKVNNYIIQPNIITLTNVNGTFQEGDAIGYLSSGSFIPTGRIVSSTKLSDTSTRLYVSSDLKTSTAYSATNILQNARFDQNGTYSGNTAFGTYTNSSSFQVSLNGAVENYTGGTASTLPGGATYVTGTTSIKLSSLASAVNNFYNGTTINVKTTNQKAVTSQVVVGQQWMGWWDDWGWMQDIVQDVTVWETYTENYTATITAYDGATKVATLSTSVNVSLGNNRPKAGQPATNISSTYSIRGSVFVMSQATSSQVVPSLSTDEYGNFSAILELPGGTFRTGDRIIRVDNRTTDGDPDSATTFAQGIFTASSLATKSTSLNFGATIQAAAAGKVFTSVQQQNDVLIQQFSYTVDPVAQTFIIDQNTYPNGAFIKSIKVFFKSKPTGTSAPPVRLFLTDTLNGYPNGQIIDGTLVAKTSQEVNVSNNPQYLDRNTYTEFEFDYPIYIRSGNLYAFILQTTSPDYVIWIGSQNAVAVPSSVKNLPTDTTPTVITKIGGTPYIGSLFESQNGITWSADQTKQMMFVIDNCIFNTAANPSVQFVVPKKIPMRKMVGTDIDYANDANFVINVNNNFYAQDVKVDAFNITTTDFEPTGTELTYEYTPTLYNSGFGSYTVDTSRTVEPGKYGTTMMENIYLNDGKGSRVLDSNSSTSFTLTAQLSTTDKFVSPVISDDGLTVYSIKYLINNMGIANTDVTVTSGNIAGVTAVYSSTPPAVTISAPTLVGGEQAFATANLVSNGNAGQYIVDKINITASGSGYITTPTITIASNGAVSATASVSGETSAKGGNAWARYITKKVVLTPENDSGDLRVYYTAYKPVGSQILVYYKILNRNDTEEFDDQNWQLMTDISAGSNTNSRSRDDLREFVAAPGTGGTPDNSISYTSTSGITYAQFSQFAIKIVLASSDSARTPIVHDLRVLALPSGS
jgi:hypothetical protein